MKFDFPAKTPHELVLFFYPSPGLNWMNPKGLTYTTTRNKLLGRPRAIGHVTILVRSPDGFFLTGMTQLLQNEGRREVLFGGYGLGILLHNFKGALEKQEKLIPELEKRSLKPGWLSYFRVATNEKTNARLREYLEAYKKNNYDAYYGMKNRPLCGEGSGCSAFAASFLETAGILSNEFRREWTRHFNIPHDLIGGPITGKKVSVIDVIRRADRWAQENEPHEKGFFWDPDLMHAWLVRTHDREIRNPSGEFIPETWNASAGIAWDMSAQSPPTGKIFQHL